MKITIIIPTYNRPNDLKNLLNSVLTQTLLPNEVIVVDQSEGALTKKLVESFNKISGERGISFIWHYQKEKGSAKARNEGFRLSQGGIICFTDDDVVLDKNYIREIVNCFEKYPQIGGISGNAVAPNPPKGFKWLLRKLLLKIFLIDFINARMTASGFGFPIYQKEVGRLTYVELFNGYSMNFRRRYLENDIFDEYFTGYSFREDVELSYRISKKTKLAMIPEARLIHNNSTINRLDSRNLKRMQFKNYYYIFNKHKNGSFLSEILFGYSIFGILMMDFLQYLFNLGKNEWDNLNGDLSAVFELMRGKL